MSAACIDYLITYPITLNSVPCNTSASSTSIFYRTPASFISTSVTSSTNDTIVTVTLSTVSITSQTPRSLCKTLTSYKQQRRLDKVLILKKGN